MATLATAITTHVSLSVHYKCKCMLLSLLLDTGLPLLYKPSLLVSSPLPSRGSRGALTLPSLHKVYLWVLIL